MTEVLTVPTHFGDISELSEGLIDRVDDERIILYGPAAYTEGEQVGFSILLVDGTAALEGIGTVTHAVDGGEDRDPETRFDIVFDSLQLDGRSEVVYESIVLARQSRAEGQGTGEVDISEIQDVEEEAFDSVDATVVGEMSDFEAAAAPPAFEPDGHVQDEIQDIDMMDGAVAFEEAAPAPVYEPPGSELLERRVLQPSWFPAAVPKNQPSASSGLFAYGGPIPIPAEPPRPEIDPSMRIAPAPSPSSPRAAASVQEAAPTAQDESGLSDHALEAGDLDADLDVGDLEVSDSMMPEEISADANRVELPVEDETRQVEMPEADMMDIEDDI